MVLCNSDERILNIKITLLATVPRLGIKDTFRIVKVNGVTEI